MLHSPRHLHRPPLAQRGGKEAMPDTLSPLVRITHMHSVDRGDESGIALSVRKCLECSMVCLLCSRYAHASDAYRVTNRRQHDTTICGKLIPVKKRHGQSRAREHNERLAREGRRNEGASAAWPALFGIAQHIPRWTYQTHRRNTQIFETRKICGQTITITRG